MATVAGIDPGLRACGLALADARTGRVLRATLVKNPETEDDGARAWECMSLAVKAAYEDMLSRLLLEPAALLVVERQYLPSKRSENPRMARNPNQLIGLMCVVGGVICSLEAERKISIYPSQWKGGLKADDCTAKVWRQLDKQERAVSEGASLSSTGHNVIDGIGIAKWASKRFAQLSLL